MGEAVSNHLTAFVSTKGGKVDSLEENEDRIANFWFEYQEFPIIQFILPYSRLVSKK